MKIEEKIALKNKQLSQHFQKWDFLTKLLWDDLSWFPIVMSFWLPYVYGGGGLGRWVGGR